MTNEQMKEFLKEGWKAVLPESEAADTSDFFADGGDSIKAVQLTGWLLQKGVKLDMVKVFTTPVLGEMAGTLTETQPMYVPQEMLAKEILKEKFGIDPAMVSAYPDAGKATQQTAAAPSQNPQMCTPAQNGQAGPSQNAQMCTPAQNPQMCTPAQNPQMCTPAQNPQMCTPAQNPQMCTSAQNPQMCTPAQNPQMCTPAQNPQMCTPAQNQQMCTPAQNPQMCTPAGGMGMMPMTGDDAGLHSGDDARDADGLRRHAGERIRQEAVESDGKRHGADGQHGSAGAVQFPSGECAGG